MKTHNNKNKTKRILTLQDLDEIERILIDIFDRIGIQMPYNFKDIFEFVSEDVCDTADPINWNDDDVAIGFRRWIESRN